ncbi:MAG: hypothetical protein SGCHY_004906, partial [Lobulomycetales sp.]
GVTGGFVPAVERRRVTLQSDRHHLLHIEACTRDPVSGIRREDRTLEPTSDVWDRLSAFIRAFKHMPEPGPESRDVFGLDISLEIDDECGFRWQNRVHGACCLDPEDHDKVPTEEQCRLFEEFVQFILNL